MHPTIDGPDLRSARLEPAARALDADGFARMRGAFAVADLREVERLLDGLLLGPGSRSRLARTRDQSEGGHPATARQPEIVRPTLAAPRLRRTRVYRTCCEMAAALIGTRSYYLFDHAIYKMPRSGTATPWHQDLAYLGPFARDIRSLHFWIPLEDTPVAGGALMFVAGSHRWPLLEHVRAYPANPHVLTAARRALPPASHAPLDGGDVSIHTPLTLHAAGPNDTDRIRKAWIIHFGAVPVWHKHLLKLQDRVRRQWRQFGRRAGPDAEHA